ncbi:MAG TPA: integrase arm-type DNA-binding domain-containing protein, partial [Longimicrobiaceae bacterium]|nr:integrase arm-type DNA-binding domain-containing protein [Longimicrobiaceae bacterium]
MAQTKRDLDRLRYDPAGPKTQIHYDGDDRDSVPGFGVRVYPSGRLAFVVWYRTGSGRKRLHTIGRYGVLTVGQARELARKTLVEAQGGADPLAERRHAREGTTLADFADIYLQRHAKPHKKSWKGDEEKLRLYIVPALGSHKLEDITRSQVAALHNNIGRTHPTGANRVLALLLHMFNLAADWGFLEETARNPAKRIKKFREASRERWITPAELPRLVEAINAEESPYVRAAIHLYLYTGLRRSELLGLRWKDIDFERRELHLGET